LRSLRWKLGGALLLVVLISVGIMAFLTNQNTTSQFQQYVYSSNTTYTQNMVKNLEQYYTQTKSWSGVQEILNLSLRSSNDRLVLADNSGKIVADTANLSVGKSSGELGSGSGTPVLVSGQQAGTLYTFLSFTGTGRGYMGGRGMTGNTGSPPASMIQNVEEAFLGQINNYLWIAGIIALAIAFLIGLFLTRQITRPITALAHGAGHIAEGDLSHRVKINSRDEIGKLAVSFNNMAVKLENSEQARKRLVSDVTHELRTPLTIIEGTVDGIIDGIFQPDREHLGSIKEQTALLTHLVSDLRDLSLAESHQLKLELTHINIVELLRRKLAQFAVPAGAKNIQLRLDATTLVPEIKVDVLRIDQVITNLLSNAIRHTPEGGQIIASVKKDENLSESGKASILLSVADNGEGIPAAHLPHLFERFYRVESSRSRSEGGAGLGLAIVKQMVEAHGGQVWVESQPGRGSIFYISLPF
jgi:signal transduction histidine kinase